MLKKVPAPKTSNPVLPNSSLPTRLAKVKPLLRKPAKPRPIYIMPRVAINGATLNLAMIKPVIVPRTVPIINEISTIIQVWG